MKRIPSTYLLLLLLALLIRAAGAAPAGAAEWYDGWQLEEGVSQANVILVARVASIGQSTVVQGAKTDTVLREYRFRPVSRLKGLFERDELSLSSTDMTSLQEYADAPPLVREGEYRLLMLIQQPEFTGCVGASQGMSTFSQRIPLLTGPDDPIVATAETLLRASEVRSRRERAELVVATLGSANGAAAAPLIASLRRRPAIAAQIPAAFDAMTRLAESDSPALRDMALAALRDLLQWHAVSSGHESLERASAILRNRLAADRPATISRIAATQALGRLISRGVQREASVAALLAELEKAPTHAERAGAAEALTAAGGSAVAAAVLKALGQLPLDHDPGQEAMYIRAALQLDRARAIELLVARLEQANLAQQSIAVEARLLGEADAAEGIPALLAAAEHGLGTPDDHYAVAEACAKLADERAVPLMARWLRSADSRLQWMALDALEAINTPAAALDLGMLVRAEQHLPFKLRLARLAARQGRADLYALASEHLADADQTIAAALVLSALNDPRAAPQLTRLFRQTLDRRWRGAALTGLVALNDAETKAEILTILADERHPLIANAAAAVGLSSDPELLTALAPLIESRGAHVAAAALIAVRRYHGRVRTAPRGLAAASTAPLAPAQSGPDIPPETRERLAAALHRVLLDPFADANVRQEAYWTARVLGGEEYRAALKELADQTEMESSGLLQFIEADLYGEGATL
jgi:hypothetical protein